MSTKNYYDKRLMCNADLTDNPRLFKNFYWGRGGVSTQGQGASIDAELTHKEVFQNRNLFNNTIDMVKCPSVHNLQRYHFAGDFHNRYETKLHDHHEEYTIKCPHHGTLTKGRVILIHPYGDSGHEELTQRGFLRAKCMYGSARTYIKVVDCIYTESELYKAGGSLAVAASLGYNIRPLLLMETTDEAQHES